MARPLHRAHPRHPRAAVEQPPRPQRLGEEADVEPGVVGDDHRVAGELVRHRLLDKGEYGYRLAGGLFELGMRAATERTLLEVAMPFLQDLYERTHETVHLGLQ